MPEPRETHAAIDARRNAQRGGGERKALAEVLREATVMRDLHPDYERLADAILAAGWIPGDQPCPVHDWQQARAERDALAATVARIRDLLTTGPIGRQTGERYIPAWEIRAALDAAASDPATEEGSDG